VAEELVRLKPQARIVFACSSRDIDRRILEPLPYALVPQPVRPLPGRLPGVPGFLRAWRRSRKLARNLLGDLKPAGVLGLGGFAAAPVVARAAKAGMRTAMLNPDAIPGRANRYLARFAEVIFTQFDSTREHFPGRVRGKVRCVGCPVRKVLAGADRAEALRHFALRDDRRTLLVLGGSLGAESINRAFAALRGELGEFSDAWQALHVTGPQKAASDASGGGFLVRPVEYCDRMDLAYAAADLALCRAGAVTVAELSATGTPAVLMPYPHHADRHQQLNASPLAEAGAGRICQDAGAVESNTRSLRESLIPIMRQASLLQAMERAAVELGRPRAAETVAAWLAAGG